MVDTNNDRHAHHVGLNDVAKEEVEATSSPLFQTALNSGFSATFLRGKTEEELRSLLSRREQERSKEGEQEINIDGVGGDAIPQATVTVRFRRSRGSRRNAGRNEEHADRLIFPPTVYSDSNYTRGILIPDSSNYGSNDEEESAHSTEEITVEIPADYFRRDTRDRYHNVLLPTLTQNEGALWNHSIAAFSASKRRYPMNVARLLGTITLYFDEKKDGKRRSKSSTLYDLSYKYCKKNDNAPKKPSVENSKFIKTLSKKQAMTEARLEMGLEENVDEKSLPLDAQTQIELRSEEILQFWKNTREAAPMLECWSRGYGSFVTSSLGIEFSNHMNDKEFYVPIPCLLDWLRNERGVQDLAADRMSSLYGGLRQIPTDASSVFEALIDLSDTKTLYKIPLITPVAMASCIVENEKVGRWKVRIGVYMNRLLPEVLTSSNLHCVMSSLDDDSYIVTEPLHIPPMTNDAVFESSKYPIVRLPGLTYDDDIDEDDMSTSSCEEKKEEDDAIKDPTVLRATRVSKTISPFTPKGLLKLIENTGTDCSQYPRLAQSLSSYLKLDLMLHQQHCLCWMTQMEHLDGFGINSIIWEEREFLDGGKYYYSPALGQIRLGKPPRTVGGCVADEMGLGKTLQMLSLIASSLEELRHEAKNGHDGGNQCTHATLIIVPPSLVMQWFNEVKKSCGESLKVDVLDVNKSNFCINDLRIESGGKGSDILITTYNALEKSKSICYLSSWSWGRVVLDEQQEIRSSTTKIAQNCESLNCHRRWMLSGTPIFEGVEDLRGELNFLRLSPFAAKYEDGFFNFSVMNHWNQRSLQGLETLRVLGLVILRRGKSMTIRNTGSPIMEQRKLTIEAVPVAQSSSERALYCWFESLVSKELNRSEDSETKSSIKSRTHCLRMLGSICFSAVMINGGLGVHSKLKELNEMLRKRLQNELDDKRTALKQQKKADSQCTLSCDEALRFLSQYQKSANVGEAFVSEQQFRGGGGATSRARATQSVQEQCQLAQEMIDDSTKKASEARRKRAKAHWHLALELITTGALCDDGELIGRVSFGMLLLWKCRRFCRDQRDRVDGHQISIPSCFQRGWRPNLSFVNDVLQSHPAFVWARDHTFRLDFIPSQVTKDEIVSALFEASKREPRAKSKLQQLQKSCESEGLEKRKVQCKVDEAQRALDEAIAYDRNLIQPTVIEIPRLASHQSHTDSCWMAFVRVRDDEVHKQIMRQAESKTGIVLPSSETIPRIQAILDVVVDQYNQAHAEHSVHPCAENKKRKLEAQKKLDRAKIGLTIYSDSVSHASTSLNVVLTRAFKGLRAAPQSSIITSCVETVEQATLDLEKALSRLQEGRQTLTRLEAALKKGFSQEFTQRSAFDILLSIRRKRFEETMCTICLGYLGANYEMSREDISTPVVSMIACGHFFCVECLDQHIHSEISRFKALTCPLCRQSYNKSSDVMLIDHNLNEDEENERRHKEAKAKVLEASNMLASSEGVALEGELWNALYLSIPVPSHVSHDPHHLHTALPREFLAHVRAATGMEACSSRLDRPTAWSEEVSNTAGLSSKIQQLLIDLPQGEHAVVFATTKENVLHLETVLKAKLGNHNCFSLYTGQDSKTAEEAVSSWSFTDAHSRYGPVLVVQAGAAAAGLTLTTASKLFIMEPFSRHEEEQQAYARLHRYGQKKDVHVRIYYAPVSVESRLLVWRRRSAEKISSRGNDDAHFIYNDRLFEDGSEESDEESLQSGDDDSERRVSNDKEADVTVEDDMRTKFLLGLVDEDGNPTASKVGDDPADDYDSQKISARRFILE